jgi:predicted dehydrogenase
MNRRAFIRSSAAAAVALAARSNADVLGTNDRVNLGIIGLGRRGTIVSGALLEDPRARIVAVSDVYPAQTDRFLAAVLKNGPAPEQYVAYQDLLARKDVDAVLITTPDHLHVTIARDALAAKKHVYLEKPTLHHWEEREPLLQVAHSSDRVLQCGMQQRSGAHYMRARQEIFDQGKLGKVLFARAVWHNFPWQRRRIPPEPKPATLDWDRFLGPAPHVPYTYIRYTSWRYFPDYGNGLLADILTHWVDVAQWMLNDPEPQSAAALGGIYQLEDGRVNPDTVSALVRYRDWNLNFESSVLPIRNDRPSVFFEGTEGTLDLARQGYVFTPNDGSPVTIAATESLERAHTRNFLDAITAGKPLNAPLQAGIDASRPVQMALRSYWSRKLVSQAELS